jgi:hypothetical protein
MKPYTEKGGMLTLLLTAIQIDEEGNQVGETKAFFLSTPLNMMKKKADVKGTYSKMVSMVGDRVWEKILSVFE